MFHRFIDGRFIAAQKGGTKRGGAKRAKGAKLMAVADCAGLPIAVHTASAVPPEGTLGTATLAALVVAGLPRSLIGDRA